MASASEAEANAELTEVFTHDAHYVDVFNNDDLDGPHDPFLAAEAEQMISGLEDSLLCVLCKDEPRLAKQCFGNS